VFTQRSIPRGKAHRQRGERPAPRAPAGTGAGQESEGLRPHVPIVDPQGRRQQRPGRCRPRPTRLPRRPQDQPVGRCDQQAVEEHDEGRAAGGVKPVVEDLRQPEHRVGGIRRPRPRVGERVHERDAPGPHDLAADGQMPPEIVGADGVGVEEDEDPHQHRERQQMPRGEPPPDPSPRHRPGHYRSFSGMLSELAPNPRRPKFHSSDTSCKISFSLSCNIGRSFLIISHTIP